MEIFFDFVKAFLVGGGICSLAQVLIDKTKLTSGKILVFFLLAGVVLQAFGLYRYLVDFGGAGATVPISGFGYLLAEGARKGAKESLFKAITGGLSSASMGVTAAIVFGYVFAVLFTPKSKPN